jgi:hypothetical protein
MRTLLAVIIGTPLGGFSGYLAGIYLACDVFHMGNLCGLLGVFITGPLGAIGGGIAGWLLARRSEPK